MTDEPYDSTDALSLRALQVLDEIASLDWLILNRPQLIAAQDELGERLGLECTGHREPGTMLAYDHGKLPEANRTCPIHEWLTVSDYHAIRETEKRIEDRARY